MSSDYEDEGQLETYDEKMERRVEAEKAEREELQAEAEQLQEEVSELGGRLKSTRQRLMTMTPLTDADSANAIEVGLMQAKKSAGIKIGAEDFQNPSNMDLIVGED